MSLASLCSKDTATLVRVASTSDAAMGQDRTYSTANRTTDGVPTSSKGRLQQLGDDRRMKFDRNEVEIDAVWYTVTDPELDERDGLIVGGKSYFVQGQRNPDLMDRFYRVDLRWFANGFQ